MVQKSISDRIPVINDLAYASRLAVMIPVAKNRSHRQIQMLRLPTSRIYAYYLIG